MHPRLHVALKFVGGSLTAFGLMLTLTVWFRVAGPAVTATETPSPVWYISAAVIGVAVALLGRPRQSEAPGERLGRGLWHAVRWSPFVGVFIGACTAISLPNVTDPEFQLVVLFAGVFGALTAVPLLLGLSLLGVLSRSEVPPRQ